MSSLLLGLLSSLTGGSSEEVESGTAVEATPGTGATSKPKTLTAHASNNTEGDWVELIAATDFAATWLIVHLGFANASGNYLVDIGTGAALSETTLIPNIHYTQRVGFPGNVYAFPIAIAQGSRISARVQCSTGSQTVDCWVAIAQAPIPDDAVPTTATAYGTTATSGLTQIDPGGTANTKPAAPYTQITASTTGAISWLLVMLGGNTAARGATPIQWLLDIGTGASSSEVNLIADMAIMEDNSSDQLGPTGILIPVQIAAGTRLSARCQCSVNTATERLLWLGMIGLG